MRKKLILLFCALGMALYSWAHDFTTGGIYYNITSTTAKTAEVTYNGFGGNYTKTGISIPGTVTDSISGITYTVTAIGESAFFSCTSVSSISLPGTITCIGNSAFNMCRQLSAITLPSALDSIGYVAFSSCSKLTSINIPASVKYIGRNAFGSCSLLGLITVDGANTQYMAADSVLYTKNQKMLICYPAGQKKTTYTVPSTVDSIYRYAFKGCKYLSVLTIPSAVKYIGPYAFSSCSVLKSVSIAASVSLISYGVFEGDHKLAVIDVDKANANYSSVDSVLFSKNLNTLICYPPAKPETTYSIPSQVDSVADYAFEGCNNLSTVSIPNTVKALGFGVFLTCQGLTSIALPSSITKIPDATFEDCLLLKTVTISDSVRYIGDMAFYSCDSIVSFKIPAKVNYIGSYAFAYCTALKSIYAYPVTPVGLAYGDYVFYSVDTVNCTLHVPQGSLSAYKAADVWKGFKTIVDDLPVSSISSAQASPAGITVQGGHVVISNAEANLPVNVYTLQGAAIYSGKSSGDTQAIALPQHGVYIVRVGEQSVKVVY